MARVTQTVDISAVDKLEKEIKEILDEYADELNNNVALVVQEIARVGVNDLRANSRAKLKRSKKYAPGWRYDIFRERLYTYAVIHNSKQPGLPHLLEYGHVTRNGTGRIVKENAKQPTPAHQHIKEIEDAIVRDFTEKVIDKL